MPSPKIRIRLYNYDTSTWESHHYGKASSTDDAESILHVLIPGDPDPYINGSNQVKARIMLDDEEMGNWDGFFDQVGWRIVE